MYNTTRSFHLLPLLGLLLGVLLLSGCQSAYYGTMEKFGVHKRDIMIDRVEEARSAQEETKEQFKSALAKFQSVVNVPASDLKQTYETLNAEFEECEARAEEVHDRITAIEDVSEALFEEWQQELTLYSSASLRQQSERKLNQTKRDYRQLISAMKQAERTIDPVLNAFRDQVLFLKHNLNAQAIASIRGELGQIQLDVDRLIRDMETSIARADSFVNKLQQN